MVMPTITVDHTDLDPCQVGVPVSIVHGRSDVSSQPDAPTLDFTWLGPIPPGEVGDRVDVWLPPPVEPLGPGTWGDTRITWGDRFWTWNGDRTSVWRFSGEITGLLAHEELGLVVDWHVTATGWQARLGRRTLTYTAAANSTDTDRAHGIFNSFRVGDLNPYRHPVEVRGAPGVTVLPHDYTPDQVDPLSVLQELATQSAGLLWQQRDGTVTYGSMYHRDVDPVAVVDCTLLADGVQWDQQVENIVNRVTVEYGPDASRATVVVDDTASLTKYNVMAVQVSTELVDDTNASTMGAVIIARRKDPYWMSAGVTIALKDVEDPQARDILDLDVGDGLYMPIPVTPGPTPSVINSWTVEGWQEVWDEFGVHDLMLAVVDRQRWGTSGVTSWQSVRDAGTWGDWQATTWLDMLTDVGGPT